MSSPVTFTQNFQSNPFTGAPRFIHSSLDLRATRKSIGEIEAWVSNKLGEASFAVESADKSVIHRTYNLALSALIVFSFYFHPFSTCLGIGSFLFLNRLSAFKQFEAVFSGEANGDKRSLAYVTILVASIIQPNFSMFFWSGWLMGAHFEQAKEQAASSDTPVDATKSTSDTTVNVTLTTPDAAVDTTNSTSDAPPVSVIRRRHRTTFDD